MKRKLIGKTGRVKIIRIFASVSNTDLNEGRGSNVDYRYYRTLKEAKIGALGVGVMASDGDVSSRLAVEFGDGSVLLLARSDCTLPAYGAPIVKFSKPRRSQIKEMMRRKYS